MSDINADVNSNSSPNNGSDANVNVQGPNDGQVFTKLATSTNRSLIDLNMSLDREDYSVLAAHTFETRVREELAVLDAEYRKLNKDFNEVEIDIKAKIDSYIKSKFPQFYEPLPAGFAMFDLEKDKVSSSTKFTRNDESVLMLDVILVITFKKSNLVKLATKSNSNSYYAANDSYNNVMAYCASVEAPAVIVALITDRENLSKAIKDNRDAVSAARDRFNEVDSVQRAARSYLITTKLNETEDGRALLSGIANITKAFNSTPSNNLA